MNMSVKKKLKSFLRSIRFKGNLVYIVDGAKWSIYWDGKNIVSCLNGGFGMKKILKGKIDTSYSGYKNKIVHLGSFHLFFECDDDVDISNISLSNKIILTIFHFDLTDSSRIERLLKKIEKIDLIHTSCSMTKEQLITSGVSKEKIVVVPLGVDLSAFKAIDKNQKKEIRKSLDLPQNRIVIGSFQKDGNGWEAGLQPKTIKGPDVFCDVIEKISKHHPVHVLLTGPARGYVVERLKKAKISYTYRYLSNYLDVVKFYQALDLYIIASRVEGGPKAVLESMACGVPFVSTKVGMVPDVVNDGKNGLVADVEDVSAIARNACRLIEKNNLRRKIIKQALCDVQKYDWKNISKEYYDKIYSKVI